MIANFTLYYDICCVFSLFSQYLFYINNFANCHPKRYSFIAYNRLNLE